MWPTLHGMTKPGLIAKIFQALQEYQRRSAYRRLNLLQGNEIGIEFGNGLGDPQWVLATITADRAMDIVTGDC